MDKSMSLGLYTELNFAELQTIALALAKLAQERPGWRYHTAEIARGIGAEDFFLEFEQMYPAPSVTRKRTPRRIFT